MRTCTAANLVWHPESTAVRAEAKSRDLNLHDVLRNVAARKLVTYANEV